MTVVAARPADTYTLLEHPDIHSPRHRRQLTAEQARELTDTIRTAANRLWMLVAVAHERRAWKALGYESWKAYVTAELGISESRSYQLVDTGRVMLTVADAAGISPDEISPISARTVAAVKDQLPALAKAIKTAVTAAADDPELVGMDEVIVEAIAAVRDVEPKAAQPTRNTWVSCPVCDGAGNLGRGSRAKDLAQRAARWRARYTG